MANRNRVIGIHPVPADEPVHLVEIEVEGHAADFDFGKITQEVPGHPTSFPPRSAVSRITPQGRVARLHRGSLTAGLRPSTFTGDPNAVDAAGRPS